MPVGKDRFSHRVLAADYSPATGDRRSAAAQRRGASCRTGTLRPACSGGMPRKMAGRSRRGVSAHAAFPRSSSMTAPRPPSAVPLRRLAFLLGGLAMFGPFSIDTIFPAFERIGAELGADKVAMQQTISVYLVAYALMSVVHGPLSDAIGRRKVIIGGLTVFALASVGCALARDLPTLLAFRALQGLSAGVGLIVGRAVIRDVLHGDDAQRLMSQVSMIFGVAPAIAPIIGGWILGWSHWSAIFWFLVGFALL